MAERNSDIIEEYFGCDCFSAEHQFRLLLDTEEKELYLDVHLHQYRNLFQRIVSAIKYIFGYKCKYGNFDTVIIRKEDIPRLKALVDRSEKVCL